MKNGSEPSLYTAPPIRLGLMNPRVNEFLNCPHINMSVSSGRTAHILSLENAFQGRGWDRERIYMHLFPFHLMWLKICIGQVSPYHY